MVCPKDGCNNTFHHLCSHEHYKDKEGPTLCWECHGVRQSQMQPALQICKSITSLHQASALLHLCTADAAVQIGFIAGILQHGPWWATCISMVMISFHHASCLLCTWQSEPCMHMEPRDMHAQQGALCLIHLMHHQHASLMCAICNVQAHAGLDEARRELPSSSLTARI